ncbi:MAG TPA: restriction endonuclease [Anaerolineales bacterium]|nr:restriction endonuclease [Anaerolineales bacterium]
MSTPILYFSEYIEDYHEKEYWYGHPNGHIETDWQLPTDYQNFYRGEGLCPFCKKNINKVFHEHMVNDNRNQFDELSIEECGICGWWVCKVHYEYENDWIPEGEHIYRDWVKYGILKQFSAVDIESPIKALLAESHRDKGMLSEMNSHKFEERIQRIFSSFYNCTVQSIGISHDGEIDLILIQKEDPVLIQVERSREQGIESISTIGNLLGVSHLNDAKREIVLSIAKTFKSSGQATGELVQGSQTECLQLINFDRFCSTFKVAYQGQPRRWEDFIEEWKK